VTKKKFRDILFKTAVFAMACDGEIHETEIEELKNIAENTSYFEGIKYKSLLEELVKKIRKRGRSTIKEYFKTMIKGKFTSSEELLILEVALRIIQADKKIDQNEERFVRILRKSLLISDEVLRLRFGNIEYIMATKEGAVEEVQKIIPDNVLHAVDDIDLGSLESQDIKEK